MASPAEQRVRVRLQRNEWVAPTGEEAFCAQPIAPAAVTLTLTLTVTLTLALTLTLI